MPLKACGVSDYLSGDMLAPSWFNLALLYVTKVNIGYEDISKPYLAMMKVPSKLPGSTR